MTRKMAESFSDKGVPTARVGLKLASYVLNTGERRELVFLTLLGFLD